MLITKTATIALVHTGMSRERARFQARSAFSGAGFTTTESELVVKHPIRRRVITLCILLGNAGVVTAISSLILGFVGADSRLDISSNIYLLIFGASFLYLAARSDRLDRFLEAIINRLLDRYTGIRPKSFSKMISIMEDFEVSELAVDENEWLKGRSLAELELTDEGILVLGILKDEGNYLGVPQGHHRVEAKDRLILYGKAERIASLSRRRDRLEGKARHAESVESHAEEVAAQESDLKEK